MAKSYKITYKLYPNDRLKHVLYHGKLVLPLYVQITYERKSIVFKSYYFDLFIKHRYSIFMDKIYGPPLEDVQKQEIALIEFIVKKLKDEFSIEKFKEAYAYYSTDLCDETEPGFIEYLHVFFQDEGMPYLATTVWEGAKYRVLYDVVRDMKRAFKEPLYKKLVENAIYYAPPYLPIFGFMQTIKKWPMLYLSVMEWDSETIRDQFSKYVKTYYPDNSDDVEQQIEEWLSRLKKRKQSTD